MPALFLSVRAFGYLFVVSNEFTRDPFPLSHPLFAPALSLGRGFLDLWDELLALPSMRACGSFRLDHSWLYRSAPPVVMRQ